MKNSGSTLLQISVIESPMNTTRFPVAAGVGSVASAARYFARLGQSASVRSICATLWAAAASSADVHGEAGCAAVAEACEDWPVWALAGHADNSASAAIVFKRRFKRAFMQRFTLNLQECRFVSNGMQAS